MAVVRKKQDDKNLKILRELVSLSGNKQCFDCNQKGPTYVNMTIGSFVCTRCSGVLRGLTPPHRVKSISMAKFTSEEIEFIKSHGNELCAKTWLGLWDPKRVHTQDHRELMIDKYERKRFYLEAASPLKSITNTAQLAPTQKHQLNSATLLTNGSAKSVEENNGILWTNSKTSNDSSNRGWISTNDNNSLFTNRNTTSVTTNGSSNKNGTPINGITLNGNKARDAIKKNGFHLPPPGSNMHNGNKNNNNSNNINNNNLFTPDTDFVADFSSANIFDALNNKPSINNTSTNNTNNLLNGNSTVHHSNGFELTNGNQINGNNNSVDENFADFEHNTIYNAAAIENQNNNNNNINNSNSNNHYNTFGYNNNSTHSNNANAQAHTQWSVWQQFPWPYIQPEQNRWSLPMSLSSTSNSLKSSGTFNSNSSINSTPSVDRYAALKDLDEQLREIKEGGPQNNTLSAATSANPFNVNSSPSSVASVQANPFQTTSSPLWFNEQQQQHQQPANGANSSVNGGLTGAQPVYPMTNGTTNGMYEQTAFGLNGSIFNGNGMHYTKVTDTNLFNGSLNMANGFPQKNPFAAPVLNATTNPFL